MRYSRYIFLMAAILALTLFPKKALSFGLDDIELNAGSSVDGECNNLDIQGILDKLDGSIEDRVLDEIKNSFSPKQLLPLVSQIIQCYVSDLQILDFGTGVSAPGNAACTRSMRISPKT